MCRRSSATGPFTARGEDSDRQGRRDNGIIAARIHYRLCLHSGASTMNDHQPGSQDIRFKVITTTLATIGFVVGMWQYHDSKIREYRIRLWEAKFHAYDETLRDCATLFN